MGPVCQGVSNPVKGPEGHSTGRLTIFSTAVNMA